MKLRILACLLVLALVLPLSINAAPTRAETWIPVGTGVDYQLFLLPGPTRAHVARMERANPAVTLESSIAGGRIAYGGETTSSQYHRVDQSINFWDPAGGARSKVLVAINGSYVIPSTYAPLSGQVVSGWYAKRFDDNGGGSGFAWTLDRRAFIGECVVHRPEKQLLTFLPGGETEPFHGVDVQRGDNKLVVYTPHYNTTTPTDNTGLEILVEMTRPNLIYPAPRYISGFVRGIYDQKGRTPIPFDHVVLSASGEARQMLLAKQLKVGDEIGISQEITSFEKDCQTPSTINWTKTYTSLSGGYHYLRDGQVLSYTDSGAVNRHPRTALAYDDYYIYFIIIDGRAPDFSIGMTIPELAAFTQEVLGAANGISEDGGGSSTMVIGGKIVNRPSDICYRTYIPLLTNGEGQKLDFPQPLDSQAAYHYPDPSVCERMVGNAVMMVQVEPKDASASLYPGEGVITNAPTNLRLGPGTNYPILATLPGGTRGAIVKHFNNLDGVNAKGYYWWKVSFDGLEGWMIENSLERTTPQDLLRRYLR